MIIFCLISDEGLQEAMDLSGLQYQSKFIEVIISQCPYMLFERPPGQYVYLTLALIFCIIIMNYLLRESDLKSSYRYNQVWSANLTSFPALILFKFCLFSWKLENHLPLCIYFLKRLTGTMKSSNQSKKSIAAGPPPKDWEDEYHRLKMRFDELKVDYNDKEQHNKM